MKRAVAIKEDKLKICKDISFENQRGYVIWFTGLSGAGKTTIISELEEKLSKQGVAVHSIDGDSIRQGLCSDLGFSDNDRLENIRRIAEVSVMFCALGFITLVGTISPREYMRELARSIVGDKNYIEIFVDAKLETCIQRDPKGLYSRALSGELPNFTGITAIYEIPVKADLILNTEIFSVLQSVEQVIRLMCSMHIIEKVEG